MPGGFSVSEMERRSATSPHKHWIMTVVGAVCVALSSAGCSSDQPAVALPTESPAPELPSGLDSLSPTASDAEEIRHVHRQYLLLLERVATMPESERRQQLAEFMTEPQLTRTLKGVAELEAKNLTTYGSVVSTITHLDIRGRTATLKDCRDSSASGLMDKSTGKKINRGVPEDSTKTTLVKGRDGRWRVRETVGLGQGC